MVKDDTIKSICNREAELKQLNDRIDQLKKVIENFLFVTSEMQLGAMRTALKNI